MSDGEELFVWSVTRLEDTCKRLSKSIGILQSLKIIGVVVFSSVSMTHYSIEQVLGPVNYRIGNRFSNNTNRENLSSISLRKGVDRRSTGSSSRKGVMSTPLTPKVSVCPFRPLCPRP